MNILDRINLKPWTIVQIVLLGFVLILALSFTFRLIGASVQSLGTPGSVAQMNMRGGGAMAPSYDMAVSTHYEEGIALSERNVMPAPAPSGEIGIPPIAPTPAPTPGSDVEDFEVTIYTGYIETGNAARSCEELIALKGRAGVVFEHAEQYDKGCRYTFKVERSTVDDVLALLESLDPKELTQQTHTIKHQIIDFTSETDILKQKLATIDETLTLATTAYDELTLLATRAQNVEGLTNIINSKLNTIERLTRDRINTVAQLDRLERALGEQLDRLEYVYFSVSVRENKVFDGERMRESWKRAIQTFVTDVNRIVQELTVGLATLLLVIAQYAVYFFILFFVVKYGWRLVVRLWKQ